MSRTLEVNSSRASRGPAKAHQKMRRLSSWRHIMVSACVIACMGAVVIGGGFKTFTQKRAQVPPMRTRSDLLQSKSIVESKSEAHAATFASASSKGADSADSCSIMEDISLPGNDLQRIRNVTSAASCCSLCQDREECLAWTWVEAAHQPFSKVCFLKGDLPRPLTKVASAGSVSGLAHQDSVDAASLKIIEQTPGQSLYCVALIQPTGYEHELMPMQYEESASLFSCDEYGLYSNKVIEIAPGVYTGVVNSTLECEMGGEFGTALNTGIFLAVWAKIISDGRFLYHDWTVKVDPDAVFLAPRLRSHLMNHLEEEGGVYINNCKYGLHGPLEVFSRNAVKAWALGAMECVEHFTQLCSGMCGWGEDMFIDQCLQRKLHIRRSNDFTMLLEDHCDPPEHWDDCKNTSAVSYHPFKTTEGWKSCYHAALDSESSSQSTMI